jgi:hypothetical protein
MMNIGRELTSVRLHCRIVKSFYKGETTAEGEYIRFER